MAITLGNTSITGLSAGGLPSGTVTSDTLAGSAVTAAKIGFSGAVLQTSFGYSNSRTTWGGDNASDFAVYLTPTASSSKILIMGVLHGHANDDSFMYLQYNIGGGGWSKLGSDGGNGVSYLGGWGDHSWSHKSNSGPFPCPVFSLMSFNTTSQVGIRFVVNAESTFYQNRGESGSFSWDGYEGGNTNPNPGVGISTLILQEIKG
jgi:hypothetical protein